MVVYFYNFQKRKNSTAIPSGMGTEREVRLKDNCSVLAPVLEVSGLSAPPVETYVVIPDFHRNYFIDNWSYFRGIWTCTCKEDYLGSWKSSIMATRAFVVLSSNNYSQYAIDKRVANLTSYDRRRSQFAVQGMLSGDVHNDASGTFVLDVINNNGLHKSGMSQKYLLNKAQMNAFCAGFQNPGLWEQLKQYYTNPLDSIVDCYYLPINIGQYVGTATASEIKLGEYTVPGVSGMTTLNTSLSARSFTMTLPVQFAYSDFRRATSCECILFFPFCGTCSLDVSKMTYTGTLKIDYSIDSNTGNIQVIAYNDDTNPNSDRDADYILGTLSGNLKVQLPVGQVQTRLGGYIEALQNISNAGASFITSTPVQGAVGVLSAFESLAVQASIRNMGGFSGSMLGATIGDDKRWQQAILQTTCYHTSTEPSNLTATLGRPCGKVLQLSSCSGYCQTSGASVSIAGYDAERDNINSLLDGGVYLD